MTCTDVERRLLTLDHGEMLSPEEKMHIANCARCRRLAASLETAEENLRLTPTSNPDLVDSVMDVVVSSPVSPQRRHGLAGWLLGGILLMAAVVAIQQSAPYRLLVESTFGPSVNLSVTTAIGLGLVAYLAVFVIANGARLEALVNSFAGWSDRGRR